MLFLKKMLLKNKFLEFLKEFMCLFCLFLFFKDKFKFKSRILDWMSVIGYLHLLQNLIGRSYHQIQNQILEKTIFNNFRHLIQDKKSIYITSTLIEASWISICTGLWTGWSKSWSTKTTSLRDWLRVGSDRLMLLV